MAVLTRVGAFGIGENASILIASEIVGEGIHPFWTQIYA